MRPDKDENKVADQESVSEEVAAADDVLPAANGVSDTAEKTVTIKQEQWDRVQSELVDYKDRYVRLYAEFDNARKRNERERQEFVKYASESLIVDFLAILDNFELSLNAAKNKHEDYEAFIKGVEMVMTHIYSMLKKNGVRPIEVEGKKFDPNSHEVLMQEPDDKVEEGTVIGVFQKGYELHGKVIRTAKVKLAGPEVMPDSGVDSEKE